jgi:SH3 domain-containing YSC84-like protein 1
MSRIVGHRRMRIVATAAAALWLLATAAPHAWAESAQNAREIIEKARLTFESFQHDQRMGGSVRALVRKAKGVMIYPQVLRGAFLVGVAGGNGVFLVRDKRDAGWSGPAFYTIGQASFGLQAGADAAEVVVVALTERGVTALLSSSAKLGANASIAIGPMGAGAEVATANLSADLVSYTRNQGLYGGVSIEGAVVGTRDGWNWAYYGKTITPTEILVEHEAMNPHADRLIAAVARVGGGMPTDQRSSADEITIEGKIATVDLSQGLLTLENGTLLTLPASFQYTSIPAVGDQVEVTYAREGENKMVREIDKLPAGDRHSNQ